MEQGENLRDQRPQQKKRPVQRKQPDENQVFQMLQSYDNADKNHKKTIRLLSGLLILFVAVIATSTFFFVSTINQMHATYIHETEEIIKTKSDVEMANQWERLPENQRRERLKSQFYEIVRYYTNGVPDEQRMNDEQILNTFNQLYEATSRLPHINFFLPVAYMKVKTNFNPVYNHDYQRGIAGFYLNTAEEISQLPLVREDEVFKTTYKGSTTLNNPHQAVKLLMARIDDLMHTFNNREDWVV
ncbi:MAG: hypothetical protein ACOCP4_04800, partial [Candidatus Woesearchaeota archaeon]